MPNSEGHLNVVWRLDHAKAVEIVGDLTAVSSNDRPGHDYVDIATPTNTLVLSRDEYVRALPPAISAAEPRLDVVDALRSSYEPEVLKHAKCWVFDDAV